MFRRLMKDTALYGLADFIFKILAFFTFPIFAHLFSVNDYGVMSFALVVAGFVGMFLTLGIGNAVQRFYFDRDTAATDRPHLVSTGYIVTAIWSLSLTAVFIVIAYFLRDYTLRKYQLPFPYVALALLTNIPTILLTYSTDVIRLHFKPVNFFILSLFRNLSGIILAIILVKYYDMGLYGYFLANVVGVAVFIPLGIYLTRNDCKFLFDKKVAKTIVRFGYPYVFAGLAYWLFGSMDRWMLSEFSTMEEAGIYSIAFKIGSIVLFINSAFGQAWSPVSIKMISDHPDDYKIMFSKLFTYWFALLLLIGSAAAFFAQEFLRFATPQPYWIASNTTIWVVIGLIFSGTTQLTAGGISISKKTKYFNYIAWVTAIINFAINYWLIPLLGSLGSAIATAITYFILSGLYLYYSQKLHYLPLERGKLIIIFILICPTILLGMYLNAMEWHWSFVLYKAVYLFALLGGFVCFKIIDLSQLKGIVFKEKLKE